MDIKDIAKALSTEFRPNDPEHFRLGVWHDGDTLENSSIKISKDLDSGDAFIDILDKKGTGMGTISDIKKHKQTFNAIRKHLPPGDYGLRADHPTKAKKYIHDYLKEPGFNLSGEKGGAKVLNKKTGKLEHKSFDTLTMTVPNKKQRLRKDHPIRDYEVKGLPSGDVKDQEVLDHLIKKHNNEPIPYFKASDGRLKYLDKKSTDKKTGVITYNFVDLTKKLEREARYAANQLKLTPNLKLFEKVFGKDQGRQIFLSEISKSRAIFKESDPNLYDIDHMGSKKFKYPHMARNLNPQESAINRSEGARLLTPQQENAFRILQNDLETTIKLQGPEMTRQQKDRELGRGDGQRTKNLLKIQGEEQPVNQTRQGLQINPSGALALDRRMNLYDRGLDLVDALSTGNIQQGVKAIAPLTTMMGQSFMQGQTGSALETHPVVQQGFAKTQDPFKASAKARKRPGKIKVLGKTIPDLGISEFIAPPREMPYRGLSSSINN